MWFLTQSLNPKFTATQQFLMGSCRRKTGLWRGGDEEVFYFPIFYRNAHLSAAGWKSLPHPAIHLTHKGNFTGRQAFSPPFFLTAPHRLSVQSSLTHTHSHTHSQAVISMLMDVQENMNVNQWETCAEKKTSTDTEKEGMGMAAYLSSWVNLLPDSIWEGCWLVWI